MHDSKFVTNIVNKLDKAFILTSDAFVRIGMQERIASISNYHHYGEWNLAFKLLCDNLYEFDLPISQQTHKLLEEIGNILEMDRKEWEILKPVNSSR